MLLTKSLCVKREQSSLQIMLFIIDGVSREGTVAVVHVSSWVWALAAPGC